MTATLSSKNIADRLMIRAKRTLIIRYYLQLTHSGMPHTLHFEIYSLESDIGSPATLTKAWGAISNGSRLDSIGPISFALCPSADHVGWFEACCKDWLRFRTQTAWHHDRDFVGCVAEGQILKRADSMFLIYHGRILEQLIKSKELWQRMKEAEPSATTSAVLKSRVQLAHRFQAFVSQLESDSFTIK